MINDALDSFNNTGIAFTYNEPVIWFEFIRDIASVARSNGLKVVLVSNGYVNPEPLEEIISFTDAFNIDLKAFNPEFYKKLTGATMEPVKESLRQVARSGKHLEITTLILPGLNDKESEMDEEAEWIAAELGKDVPLHLSRYFPMYKREDPSTPSDTMLKLAGIASRHLDHVYLGNMTSGSGQDTKCPRCKTTVTKRSGYSICLQNLDNNGKCISCGTSIYKHFNSFPLAARN